MTLQSKLPQVGTSIFSQMTVLANQHGAINLSQGFPDFDVAPELIDLVSQYMTRGLNQYAPSHGARPLRERLVAKQKKLYGADYDVETEITVTSGATEAVFAAITTVVNRGDEVIILDPAYDAYAPAVVLSGGIPVHVRLSHPDYAIDWDRVRHHLSLRTRLLLLNTPHNPTGSVLTSRDLDALSGIVAQHDLFILSDEVYEHIIFDGKKHESISSRPELARRAFVVSSLGKTYHATGWKVGYCLAPEPLTRELRKIHQYLTFSTHTPSQMAYADFLEHEDNYLNLGAFYQEKRDLFASRLEGSRFRLIPCHGSYFQMLDYSGICDQPDLEFAKALIVTHKVAAIPPSVFYEAGDDSRVLRFCFAKRDETLIQAAEKLCAV